MFNFDNFYKILNHLFSDNQEKKDDVFLDEQPINLCIKTMLAASEHKIHTNELAHVVSVLPDIDLEPISVLSPKEYGALINSTANLIKMYKDNRKKIEDIIFLLNWYQRECKKRYGKTG